MTDFKRKVSLPCSRFLDVTQRLGERCVTSNKRLRGRLEKRRTASSLSKDQAWSSQTSRRLRLRWKDYGLKVNCVIFFCFQCAHDGFICPKTALVDEEDATFYGKESLSVDESCEVEVDEPSSDSPQLPAEDAHDIIQSKRGKGEFLLFFIWTFVFCLFGFLCFLFSKFCRLCNIKMEVVPCNQLLSRCLALDNFVHPFLFHWCITSLKYFLWFLRVRK